MTWSNIQMNGPCTKTSINILLYVIHDQNFVDSTKWGDPYIKGWMHVELPKKGNMKKCLVLKDIFKFYLFEFLWLEMKWYLVYFQNFLMSVIYIISL